MIIGITGHMQAGKSTIGQYLVEDFGFVQAAFADPLKQMVLALDPWVAMPVCSTHQEDEENVHFRLLSAVVQHEGWERAKKYPDVRRLLQRMGTEAGRQVLGEDLWINHMWKTSIVGYHFDVVITDVRFKNEAVAIREWGGYVWKVTRPGYEGDGHASELEIDEIDEDFQIPNWWTKHVLRNMTHTTWRQTVKRRGCWPGQLGGAIVGRQPVPDLTEASPWTEWCNENDLPTDLTEGD